MYYYMYKITNNINGKVYIGVHSTEDLDDEYMGSGKYLRRAKEKYGIENFTKEILQFFDSKDEMYSKEREVVNEEFVARNDTYNIKCGGYGGWDHLKGYVPVKDKEGNTFSVLMDDPRYLSGELVGSAKGMVPVKDKDGNKFYVSKDDPRYLSGEFVNRCDKGIAILRDKNGITVRMSKDDPRYLSGEFVGSSKGMLSVKDKDGNTLSVYKDDPRYLSGELVPVWLGKNHTEETKSKIGKKNSVHQKGTGNSHYGHVWIYNPELKISKSILKYDIDKYLSEGWIRGRKMKF